MYSLALSKSSSSFNNLPFDLPQYSQNTISEHYCKFNFRDFKEIQDKYNASYIIQNMFSFDFIVNDKLSNNNDDIDFLDEIILESFAKSSKKIKIKVKRVERKSIVI